MRKSSTSQAEQLSGYFRHSKPPGPSQSPSAKAVDALDLPETEELCVPWVSPGHDKTTSLDRHASPGLIEKAVPRRLDWTPVKSNGRIEESPESGNQIGRFSSNLLNAYTCDTLLGCSGGKITAKVRGDGQQQLKRKRIDLVMATEMNVQSSISKSSVTNGVEHSGLSKKKAPAKKALTITGLATSAYSDGHSREGKPSPMLEYLAASQAGTTIGSESDVQTHVKKLSKSNVAGKKTRAKGKATAKSRLVSPKSAMKATNDQPFVFGPASQLARDESPTLTRDTLEALKRSEYLWSDPISPPRTQAFSVEFASPRVTHGTGRFDKKRNLWSAAGRDEDNALLQVETVDLTDSPAVRQAFAGKDALLQLDVPKYRRRGSGDEYLKNSSSTRTPCTKDVGFMLDIDDIVTPGIPKAIMNPTHSHVRALHTSRSLQRPAEQNKPEHQPENADSEVDKSSSKAEPIMPTYAGWSDHELKKQISTYGFKPIKKREKMIELLQRCWESEHGVEHDESATALTHGDFVSKVHDVSARPVPKAKKPRAKKDPEVGEASAAKKPKRKPRSATKEEDASTPKKPPRRRTKKAPFAEKVVDVDEIDESCDRPSELMTRVSMESSMQPKDKSAVESISKRPATPPATLPQLDFTSSSPAPEHPSRSGNPEIPDYILTPKQTPAPDIQAQIHAAIHCPLETVDKTINSRNHRESPTWREKILMYDPIVLEELTLWLNTDGFKMIGEDREVSLLEVRSWCELNGVCCYGMGGGWRGRGNRGHVE